MSTRLKKALPYWPHAGIVLAVVLNCAGIATGNTALIATAANLFLLCGTVWSQRKRSNGK